MKNFISLFIILGFLISVSCNKKEESKVRIRPIGYNKNDTLSGLIKNSSIKYELQKVWLRNKDTTIYLTDNLKNHEENIKIEYDKEQMIYKIKGIDSLSGRYTLWHINNKKVSFHAHYYMDTIFKYNVTLFFDLNKIDKPYQNY